MCVYMGWGGYMYVDAGCLYGICIGLRPIHTQSTYLQLSRCSRTAARSTAVGRSMGVPSISCVTGCTPSMENQASQGMKMLGRRLQSSMRVMLFLGGIVLWCGLVVGNCWCVADHMYKYMYI
jgi:hypothetical protein